MNSLYIRCTCALCMRTLNTDPTLLRYLVCILCICTTIEYPRYVYFLRILHTNPSYRLCMHTDSMDTLYTYPISRLYIQTLYENLYALWTPSTDTMQNMYSMQTLHRPCKHYAMRNFRAGKHHANPRRYGTGHRKKLLAHSPWESPAVRDLASSVRGS